MTCTATRRWTLHSTSPSDPGVSQCLPSSSPQNLCKSGDTWGFSTENNQPGVRICDCSAVSCMAASGPLSRFLLRSSPHAHSPPSSVTARVNLSPHDTAICSATLRGHAYIAPGAGARGLISAQTETQTGGLSHASAEHTNVYKATQSRCEARHLSCTHAHAHRTPLLLVRYCFIESPCECLHFFLSRIKTMLKYDDDTSMPNI